MPPTYLPGFNVLFGSSFALMARINVILEPTSPHTSSDAFTAVGQRSTTSDAFAPSSRTRCRRATNGAAWAGASHAAYATPLPAWAHTDGASDASSVSSSDTSAVDCAI